MATTNKNSNIYCPNQLCLLQEQKKLAMVNIVIEKQHMRNSSIIDNAVIVQFLMLDGVVLLSLSSILFLLSCCYYQIPHPNSHNCDFRHPSDYYMQKQCQYVACQYSIMTSLFRNKY